MHYHLRHNRKDELIQKSLDDKFNFYEIYKPKVEPNKLIQNTNFNYFDKKISTKFKRVTSFILYFFLDLKV